MEADARTQYTLVSTTSASISESGTLTLDDIEDTTIRIRKMRYFLDNIYYLLFWDE